MKRLLGLGVIILILHINVNAPENQVQKDYSPPQEESCPIESLQDPVLKAFMSLESGFRADAVNPVTGARGVLQILPIMISEANRLLTLQGSDIYYTWDDAWDVEKSIEIWYVVQGYHNPNYDVILACKIWFGRGTQYDGMTWREYHAKINERLLT